MAMLGWWSDGIRLCRTEGAASGRMMGYACRNQEQGKGIIGRWIDRRFLNYPGWEGVRQRRAAMANLIVRAIQDLKNEGCDSPVVLDIASGTADYLFDAILSLDRNITAICLDSADSSVAEGNRKTLELGLDNIRFQPGDAMDADALARLAPPPNVIISSGFYELLTDEKDVKRSLRIIANLLSPSGRLIVSHQKARPSLKGLSRHFSGPLQLQMRSPQAVEALLTSTGFQVVARTDAANLYEIFLTRRI